MNDEAPKQETTWFGRVIVLIAISIAALTIGTIACVVVSDDESFDEAVPAEPPPAEEEGFAVPFTTIIGPTEGRGAPLCDVGPGECSQEQMDEGIRIPDGTELNVIEVFTRLPEAMRPIHYFRVEYHGTDGWISEFFSQTCERNMRTAQIPPNRRLKEN